MDLIQNAVPERTVAQEVRELETAQQMTNSVVASRFMGILLCSYERAHFEALGRRRRKKLARTFIGSRPGRDLLVKLCPKMQ